LKGPPKNGLKPEVEVGVWIEKFLVRDGGKDDMEGNHEVKEEGLVKAI